MDWTRIAEGQTILASVFADLLFDTQDHLNALPSTSVELAALTREHLLSPLVDVAYKELVSTTQHEYDDNSEPYPGWGTVAGWRPINSNGSLGTGTVLEASWENHAFIDLSEGKHKILILCNIHLARIFEDAAALISNDFFCMIAIQARDQNGNWRHIYRTERYVDAESWTDSAGVEYQLAVYKDLAIRTLLTETDKGVLTTNLPDVSRIRAVVSVCDCTLGFPGQLVKVFLREANLTALAFWAGDL